MANNTLEYKGFTGSIRYPKEERGLFHGKILNIPSLLTYEGHSIAELDYDFREAVDIYLDMCGSEISRCNA